MTARRIVVSRALRTFAALSAGLALSSVVACNGKDAAADTSNVNDAVLVGAENVVVVKSEEIRTGPTLSGTIEAERSATLRAEVSAAVIETYIEAGQRVAAGTLLARLDDSGIRDLALSGRAAVATAKNADEIAAKELERAEALEKAGAIATRDLERARNAALAAQTQLASAKAMSASADKQFAKTRIVAPYAGVVSARQVNAGDFVSPGGALFTVVDPSTMRLEASLPAEALSTMKLGLPVEFTVSGYADKRFTGRVTRVNPTADPVTRQVRILATIPNDGQTLVGGMFAEGRVATQAHRAAVVPVVAVDERGVRPSVMRVKNGKVERVEIELGLRDDHTETVEVRSGVAPGDTLLLGTARGLTPGTAVRVSTPSDTKK